VGLPFRPESTSPVSVLSAVFPDEDDLWTQEGNVTSCGSENIVLGSDCWSLAQNRRFLRTTTAIARSLGHLFIHLAVTWRYTQEDVPAVWLGRLKVTANGTFLVDYDRSFDDEGQALPSIDKDGDEEVVTNSLLESDIEVLNIVCATQL